MDGYAQGLEASDSAEELCRRLMTLYQRQGRRADALALSRRRRATLVAKLGIARTRDRCAASRAARRPISLEEKNQSAALRRNVGGIRRGWPCQADRTPRSGASDCV